MILLRTQILQSYYYFVHGCWNNISKRFCYVGTQLKNFTRIENEAKQRIHAMDMHDSEYVMDCNTAIPCISNTLHKFFTVKFTFILYSNHI